MQPHSPWRGPRRAALTSLAVALVALAAACASHTRAATQPATPPERLNPDSVIVRVANHDDRALVVSLLRGTVEMRLGDVSAGTDGRFAVASRNVGGGPLTLLAITSRANVRTVPFRARAGQVIWFDVAPGLVGSRARVRWPEEGPPH